MTATAAMNIPLHYVPMRQPMKSEYLLSARRGDHPFPSRALDQKNYMLKRDLLPGLGALSIRSSSPVSARSESGSENNSPQKQSSVNSSRYKTELCRPFEEQGNCKYGDKCQFAHGVQELRTLARHPKYKTELCRTYHTVGFCPYGPRCHFVHNEDDLRPAQSPKSPCKTRTSSAVSVEHVASSHAFRNLMSNLDFYQTPVSQLSVSLGSAGEYSPTNSLSTSPVLSPVFSEDLSPPQQLLSPVWPVGHDYLPIPTPQQVPAEHFEQSLRCAREEFLLHSSGGAGSTSSSLHHSSDQYPSISSSTGHYRHGGTGAVSGAIHRTCRELTNHCHLDTTDRLPIFRRFSVEDQGYA